MQTGPFKICTTSGGCLCSEPLKQALYKGFLPEQCLNLFCVKLQRRMVYRSRLLGQQAALDRVGMGA